MYSGARGAELSNMSQPLDKQEARPPFTEAVAPTYRPGLRNIIVTVRTSLRDTLPCCSPVVTIPRTTRDVSYRNVLRRPGQPLVRYYRHCQNFTSRYATLLLPGRNYPEDNARRQLPSSSSGPGQPLVNYVDATCPRNRHHPYTTRDNGAFRSQATHIYYQKQAEDTDGHGDGSRASIPRFNLVIDFRRATQPGWALSPQSTPPG